VDELMRFFASSYEEVFGFEHPPLHDPCAVYAAIAPDAFEWRSVRVDVETSSALTAGQTVVDWWRQSPERPINCDVGVKMDVERFWRAMCEAVDNANAACPMK
jgi:inosine-uridine nucleoside N-ribohydrolase